MKLCKEPLAVVRGAVLIESVCVHLEEEHFDVHYPTIFKLFLSMLDQPRLELKKEKTLDLAFLTEPLL